MSESSAKQAILPLWGSAANATTAALASHNRFRELCKDFVDADTARDESRMSEITLEMERIVGHLCTFRKRQFRKWANEREGQRR